MTTPRSLLPASVALSSTSVDGARPTCSKISRSPSHRHSARSAIPATQNLALEWGSVRTSSLSAMRLPASTASKFP